MTKARPFMLEAAYAPVSNRVSSRFYAPKNDSNSPPAMTEPI